MKVGEWTDSLKIFAAGEGENRVSLSIFESIAHAPSISFSIRRLPEPVRHYEVMSGNTLSVFTSFQETVRRFNQEISANLKVPIGYASSYILPVCSFSSERPLSYEELR